MTQSENPAILKSRAYQALRLGQVEEAISALTGYLASVPADADAWFNLGYLYRSGRQFLAAIEAYRRAIAAGVTRAEEVRLNLAVIMADHLHQYEAAELELRAALAGAPHFIPAWLNLGMLYEDLGQAAEAEAAYRQALAVDPSNGRALGRIAMVMLHRGQAESALSEITKAIATGRHRTPDDLAELQFALGHAHDALGEYDAAFGAIEAANRIRAGQTTYRPAEVEALVDRIIADPIEASSRPTDANAAQVIFICGMFRSGSTLVEQLFARHPAILSGGECEFVPALAQRLGTPFSRAVSTLDAELLGQERQAYFSEARQVFGDFAILTDKRCDNFLHIGLIRALFPLAPIVHTRRNPLDNLVSIYFGNFDDSQGYATSLEATCHWLEQHERLMTHWRTALGDALIEIDYDALVDQPQVAMQRLAQGCALDWQTQYGDAPAAGRSVKTLSSWQVREPIHRRSAGRWRNYARQLGSLVDRLDAIR